MRVFSGTGSPGVKYEEDFTITITPGNGNNSHTLGQAVNFENVILYYMGHRSDDSLGNVTLEFNGTQLIVATRATVTGTTVVSAKIVEHY